MEQLFWTILIATHVKALVQPLLDWGMRSLHCTCRGVARRGSGVFVDWFDSTANARSRSTTYSDQSTSVWRLIHVSSATDPRRRPV